MATEQILCSQGLGGSWGPEQGANIERLNCRRRRVVSMLEFTGNIKLVSCPTFWERLKKSHITATSLSYWDVNITPFIDQKPSKFEKLFQPLKKKNHLLEENKSHARQSKTLITTIVSNNSYSEITDTSEINSCYRKWIIFYLNSNATRITWQQHNSVETMSVFDEEITLAPEVLYCDVMF